MNTKKKSEGDTQYLYIESKNINYVCENVTIKVENSGGRWNIR